jgi:Amt family ammonium transporter
VHGIGGFAGALLTGVFAQKAVNSAGSDGLLAGNPKQLLIQLLACAATAGYAALVTCALLRAIDKWIGLRVEPSDEREGLDTTQHGEEGYAG